MLFLNALAKSFVFLTVVLFLSPVFSAGTWWDSNWEYRKPITVTDSSGSELTDFQVPVDLTTVLYDNTGLVGSWHFSEGTGTIAKDSSGNGNDGILINAPVWINGKFGSGLRFDGVDDYVLVGNETSFDFERTDAFTISFWIKAEPTSTKYFPVVNKLDYVCGNKGWRILSEYTGDGLVFLIADNHCVDDVNLLLDGVLDNEWHHVVFVYDGNGITGGMKGYLDGVLKAEGGGGLSIAVF